MSKTDTPLASDELRSRIMKANRGKNTKPELLLRKALFHHGLAGYRLYWKNAPGSPDITYPNKKVAIFVNGCFWHRCPHCNLSLPKTNTEWWKKKFDDNKKRDARKIQELESIGWTALVIWECEIERDLIYCVEKVRQSLSAV